MIGSEKFHPWLKRPTLEKKDADAPDYAPLAAASKESAEIMAKLGQGQLDFAKQQYADAKPVYQQIVDSQINTQNQTNAQAKEYYDYSQKTFRPVEEGLVSKAMQYDTAAQREKLAEQAAGDAGSALAATQGASNRAMAGMGINPNSGKFAGLQNQNALNLAAMRSGAMNNTRTQAEALGYAKSMDAAGLGRGLAGASQGAYGVALNAGNSAGQNQQAPGNQYMQGLSQGASTIGAGRNMLQSGLGNVLSSQTSVYNANSQSGLDVGGLMGGAAAMYGSGMFKGK